VKVYFDTCVWCRPFDEQSKEILQEVEAIKAILDAHDCGEVEIVGSTAVIAEVSLISDKDKRKAVEEFVKTVSDFMLRIHEDEIRLAKKIKDDCMLRDVDALHAALACKHADVFVTADKGILKKARCLQKYIIVMSPVEFNEFRGSVR